MPPCPELRGSLGSNIDKQTLFIFSDRVVGSMSESSNGETGEGWPQAARVLSHQHKSFDPPCNERVTGLLNALSRLFATAVCSSSSSSLL